MKILFLWINFGLKTRQPLRQAMRKSGNEPKCDLFGFRGALRFTVLFCRIKRVWNMIGGRINLTDLLVRFLTVPLSHFLLDEYHDPGSRSN